jgi:hypothetical protein
MTIERDETDESGWPAEADPIRAAIGNLLVAIIESTAVESRERQAAMTEALGAHERIRHALAPKPTLM